VTPSSNGTRSAIDRLGLTLGDLEAIEDATGLDVLGLLEHADDYVPVKLLTALAWVSLRKSDPDLSVEDVRAMDLGDIDLDALAAGLPKVANRAARRRASGSASPGPGGSPRARSATPRSTKSSR
jgi:hypothetical protein